MDSKYTGSINDKVIGLLALCVPYSYSLYYAIKCVVVPGSLQSFCAVLFFISIFCLALKRYLTQADMFCIAFSFIFIILFYITRIKYGYNDSIYSGTFLSFCVRAVPSLFLGVFIAKKDNVKFMLKWIEPFMMIMTVLTLIGALAERNSLMVYQEVSYYAMFAYTMNVFIITHREALLKEKISFLKSKIWFTVDLIFVFVQIFCMLCGGGRGAFILFIIMTLILLNYLIRSSKVLFKVIFFGGIIVLIGVTFFGDKLQYFSELTELGTDRILSFFSSSNTIEEDQRYQIYMMALQVIRKNIVFGGGIGSVFYLLGNYSHNWLLDILIDFGIVGASIVVLLIIRFLIKMKNIIAIDWKNTIILMIFIEAFVNLCFSGCYLSDGRIWLCFAFAFSYNRQSKII